MLIQPRCKDLQGLHMTSTGSLVHSLTLLAVSPGGMLWPAQQQPDYLHMTLLGCLYQSLSLLAVGPGGMLRPAQQQLNDFWLSCLG